MKVRVLPTVLEVLMETILVLIIILMVWLLVEYKCRHLNGGVKNNLARPLAIVFISVTMGTSAMKMCRGPNTPMRCTGVWRMRS